MTTPTPVPRPTEGLQPIRLALWIALVTGLAEVLVRIFEKVVLHRVIHTAPSLFWLIPIANIAWIGIPGVILAVMARVWPSRTTLRVVAMVLSFIAYVALVHLYPSIGFKATMILSLGLAARTSVTMVAHARRLTQLVNQSLVWLGLLVVALFGGSAWGSFRESSDAGRAARAGRNAPNIVLLVLDTVRGMNLSLYGYARETSPALAHWAESGARFDEAIATAPWTLPSHAGMFTGRYAHELGTSFLKPLDGTYPTVAERLSALGYATGGFVANLDYTSYEKGLSRGFQHYEDYVVSWGAMVQCSSIGRLLLDRSSLRTLFKYYDNPDRRNAAEVNEGFFRWAGQMHEQQRPFFAFLNYFDAHSPYIPTKGYERKFGAATGRQYHPRWQDHKFSDLTADEIAWNQAQYDGILAYMDAQVEDLLNHLKGLGILEQSIVIITADHGEQFGEHQLVSHGNSLYLPLLQVPLVIRFPSRVPAGARITSPISLRDLPATIFDLAGLEAGQGLPGRSLARFWGLSGLHPAEPVLSSYAGADGPFSVISAGKHYIRWFKGKEELYDFGTDPSEAENMVATRPSAAELTAFRKSLDSIVGRPVARLLQ